MSACTQMSRDRVQPNRTRRVCRFHHRSIHGSRSLAAYTAIACARSRPSTMRRLASIGSPPTRSPGTVMPHSAWASRRASSPSTDARYASTSSTAAIRAEYARVRALVQRVSEASVTVDGTEVSRIGPGLLVLLGVGRGDTDADADRLAAKLLALRIFEDDDGRMNLNVADAGGEILCVSQFTLYGDTRKANRPSFADAAPPAEAEPLYERVREALNARGGVFGARMAVDLTNDGPVTLTVET